MSGHNKWSQIKNRKGVTDKRRGVIFSKILKGISVAARKNQSPESNPRLRSLIEQAKRESVPRENIERAIGKANEEKNLEEIRIEGYGPAGVALIIEAITDNKNRTIPEIRKILEEYSGKMSQEGGVLWGFEQKENEWIPRFPQIISPEEEKCLKKLVEALNNHEDITTIAVSTKKNENFGN